MHTTTMYLINVILFIFLCASFVKCQNDPLCTNGDEISCPTIMRNLKESRATDICKEIHCEGITPEDCVDSTYVVGLTMCGCCAGCAKYLDVDDPCEVSTPPCSTDLNCKDPFCPMLMNRCKPGLVCNYLGPSSKKCSVPEDPGAEGEDTEACQYKRNLGKVGQLHWTPECELDGKTYSPKQCKGIRHDGTCFCVDPSGKRIFGREWWIDAQNQTCACSRRVHELREAGNIATFHCAPDGNYEPLQCDTDSGVCYCVDPQTGKLNGAVLPEHQWKNLPCYSANLTAWDPTGQYLRVCESEWAVGERLYKEATMHGLQLLSMPDLKCDYDGSHASVKRVNGLWFCVDKMGVTSTHFQVLDAKPMDCLCYRDELMYNEEGRPFLKTCDHETGNYSPTAEFDPTKNTYKCIDSDGFFFGHEAPYKYICCLEGDCSSSAADIKQECFNADNPGGYRSCSSWPT